METTIEVRDELVRLSEELERLKKAGVEGNWIRVTAGVNWLRDGWSGTSLDWYCGHCGGRMTEGHNEGCPSLKEKEEDLWKYKSQGEG